MESATGGVLDWDSKVKDLLPEGEWGLEDEWATEKVNLRDLLGHVTGLPRCAETLLHSYAVVGNLIAVDYANFEYIGTILHTPQATRAKIFWRN